MEDSGSKKILLIGKTIFKYRNFDMTFESVFKKKGDKMQSDAVACRVDVVNVSFIEEICPKEYPVFLEIRKRTSLERVLTGTKEQPAWALEEAHLDFLQVVHKDGEVNIAYKKLQKAFCHRTGLKLFIDWHNSEEYGSSQDDVSEEFWYVEGVWKLSPAGEKYRDKIQLDAMYIITE